MSDRTRCAGTGTYRVQTAEEEPADLPDVNDLVAELAKDDPLTVTNDELAQLVVDAHQIANAAAARWLALVDEFDQRERWAIDGPAPTLARWLQQECRLTAREAGDVHRLVRALRVLPVTAKTFRAGQISMAHVRAIAPAAEGDEKDARQADPILARSSRWMHPGQVSNVVKTWRRVRAEGPALPAEGSERG
ncbi:DUF222 domain-containing protein [Parafrankia discariae]|uniref:DUF222 domain-containing protein n=1 Tax=Parafrankia discariae TaxID=365528 RepID=UPI00037B8231|nr:DUF222 domain-containing protein [Parafrankia discariae]